MRFLFPFFLAGSLLAWPPSSPGIFGLFDKDDKRKTPNAGQLTEQETQAASLLSQAQSLETAGKFDKAQSAYKSIVKSYPRTRAASESQFKVAEIYQANGKPKKAFENYQEFLVNFKGSPHFTSAVQRQFEIAEDLRKNGKKGFLGGLGATIQPSKLIEMYQQISANSPKTAIAAQSLLAIGYTQSSEGDLASAITAFEAVVENYAGSRMAAEAQYQLFQLHGKEAEKSYSPIDMRQQKEAGEDFIAMQENDPRISNVRESLGKLQGRESEKAYDVGRFYERRGNLKSAAVYYRSVLKDPTSEKYGEAQKRMAKLLEKNPTLASITQRGAAGGASSAVPQMPAAPGRSVPPAPRAPAAAAAAPNVTSRPDYVGPPAPDLQTAKPRMRTSGDDVLPIPTDDPTAGN